MPFLGLCGEIPAPNVREVVTEGELRAFPPLVRDGFARDQNTTPRQEPIPLHVRIPVGASQRLSFDKFPQADAGCPPYPVRGTSPASDIPPNPPV